MRAAMSALTGFLRMLDSTSPRQVVPRALLVGLLFVLSGGVARASVVNQPICLATYYQMPPSGVSNGAGGTLITWADIRSGDLDIYLQETNSVGVPDWTANGIAVCKVLGFQQVP